MKMKEAYEQKLQAQLDVWSTEIDKLDAKAGEADVNTQAEYYKQIEELRAKQDDAKEKLDELKSAHNAWEDLKVGIESAWGLLGDKLSSTKSKFK